MQPQMVHVIAPEAPRRLPWDARSPHAAPSPNAAPDPPARFQDALQLALKDATASKEEKMVSHDVLRLEMRRLKDILALRVDEVMGLENRRYQLTVSMEERKQEVEVHHAALKAQFKALHDDVHRLNLELREREMRAQALEAKRNAEGREFLRKVHLQKLAEQEEDRVVKEMLRQQQNETAFVQRQRAEQRVRARATDAAEWGISQGNAKKT